MEIIKHVLTISSGETLIGAQTLPQLEQTAMKMFKDIMPKSLVQYESKQKNYIDFYNGHRVLFRPLDDETKSRSLNLTAFMIEEASEVDYSYFVQLKARLRNEKAIEYLLDELGEPKIDFNGEKIVIKDNRVGIVSSNPSLGWIRNEFLLKSNIIQYYDIKYHYYVEPKNKIKGYTSHVVPTKGNTYLPPDFYEEQASGKPAWWVARFLEASFEYAEGMVFPNFMEHVIEPFKIPKHWYSMLSTDFGRRDPFCTLKARIDPLTGIIYIVEEFYKSEQPANVLAEKYLEMYGTIPPGTLIRQPLADPLGDNRDQVSGKSWYGLFSEYGIFFKRGHKDVVSGIMKIYTLMSLGKIKIFNTCVNTVKEGQNYKYAPQELDALHNEDEKPVDKDDHAMSCLRWLCMELYDDFNRMDTTHTHSYNAQRNEKSQEYLPHALRDDDLTNTDSYEWYGQF
jgi:hypothetical protein